MTTADSDVLRSALRVSYAAVAWTAVSGALSVVVGVTAHSAALVGTGADVLADLLSSMVLIWRFRSHQLDPDTAEHAERRAQLVASICLLVVAVGLVLVSVHRLRSGVGADVSVPSIGLALASTVVLPLFAWWKYRIARLVPSRALRTDAHISMIGASTGALTLLGLTLTSTLGLTAADPIAALAIAVIAAAAALTGLRA